MALSYVGGQGNGFAGKTATTTVAFAFAGGSDATPSVGDLIVVTYSVASTVDRALTITTSTGAINYDLAGTELYANGTSYDSNLRVAYRIYASGDGTGIILSGTGSTADAGRYTIQCFRGVDTTTPMDATPVTATGTATGRPNPGAITPVTAGAWVTIHGGGAAATGAAYTAPANFTTNFLTGTTVDTNDAMVGSGYWSGWTSGAVDPAAYTGGTANAADSWTAVTLAIRPTVSVDGSTTITGASGAGEAGTIDAAGGATSTAQGVAGAGQAGSTTESSTATIAVFGVSGVADAGAVSASAVSVSNGTATVTGAPGVGSASGLLASGSAQGNATGASGSGTAGGLTAAGAVSKALAGAFGAAAVGTVSASGSAVVNGSVTVAGASASGVAELVAAIGSAAKAVTGVSGSAAASALSASAVSSVNASISITGAPGAGAAGAPSPAAGASALVMGVLGAASLGELLATASAYASIVSASGQGRSGEAVADNGVAPAPSVDRFNYGAVISANSRLGPYRSDPVISRMAQRMRKHKRW